MTESLVRYERDGAVSTILMDDGKVNALSPAMFRELNAALDRAQSDGTVVILSGRPRRFSGGFDLGVFKQGKDAAIEMLEAGAKTAQRLLAFEAPVLIACTGHAIAMGSFLLTTGDLRIGVDDPELRICANEVEIGLTVPHFAVELCRQRLAPACFDRALVTASPFSPREAVSAGFLDLVVPEPDFERVVRERALALSGLVRDAFSATKARTRAASLAALGRAIEVDLAGWKGA